MQIAQCLQKSFDLYNSKKIPLTVCLHTKSFSNERFSGFRKILEKVLEDILPRNSGGGVQSAGYGANTLQQSK